jgi:hypothetical protein
LVVRRLLVLVAAAPLLYTSRAGTGRDPEEILARVAGMVREAAVRIPNYNCVETIERRTFLHMRPTSALTEFNQQPPRDCEGLAALKKKRAYNAGPANWDRLRLDVRVGGASEDYSWVGADRFDDRELSEVVGGYGVLADGPFGTLLLSIFQGSAAEFSFVGEQAIERRNLYAYSFRVPLQSSHFFIHILPGPTEITGYEGTLFVDPATIRCRW